MVRSTVAVGDKRRLHCAARSGVAPHNSLRSLRSLRSNRCRESEVGSALRAPTPDAALLVATDSLPTGHHLSLRHQRDVRYEGNGVRSCFLPLRCTSKKQDLTPFGPFGLPRPGHVHRPAAR